MKTPTRTIGSVVTRGHTAYVYDEKGSPMFVKPVNEDATVAGWTSSSITIKGKNYIATYDAKGMPLSRRGC
jgi:hypothetical protein